MIRFQVAESTRFNEQSDAAVRYWRACPGCLGAELLRSIDDPDLWAIRTSWDGVGSYRRSYSGYEAKMLLMPLLAGALDEPSAYLPAAQIDEPVWRSN